MDAGVARPTLAVYNTAYLAIEHCCPDTQLGNMLGLQRQRSSMPPDNRDQCLPNASDRDFKIAWRAAPHGSPFCAVVALATHLF
jgi:hypothetical protein